MKALFLDEFKYDYSKSSKLYGLAGVYIDSQRYLPFKESFIKCLKKIGWDKSLELKGRSMFSKSGDGKVSIEKRISFMSDVVSISKSKTGKTASIQIFLSSHVYDKKDSEYECYKDNLKKIIKKLPKPKSKTKSLISVYYDNNDCINVKDFNPKLEKMLEERNLNLFESPFSVKSSLENPGIMFADYVCYFHQNFLQLSKFRKDNVGELLSLLENDQKGVISPNEKKKLETYLINYKKERTTKELILALKKITYV